MRVDTEALGRFIESCELYDDRPSDAVVMVKIIETLKGCSVGDAIRILKGTIKVLPFLIAIEKKRNLTICSQ